MGWNLQGSGEKKSDNKLNNNNTKVKSGWNLQGSGKYELKNGDKTIGVISYGAKKAIESDALDSYLAKTKNEEEKKILETYKSLYSPVMSEEDAEKTNANLDDLQKEIDNLEALKNKASEYERNIQALTNRANAVKHRTTGLATGSTYEQQIKETEAEYKQFLIDSGIKDIEDLEKQLSEKKQYKNTAKYLQDGKALADNIRSDAKFEEYVAKGEALGNEKRDGWLVPDTQRKNIVAYLRNNPDAMKTFEEAAKASGKSAERLITQGSSEYKLAKYGTQEQVENYYAYLGKGDTENAKKYLESVEESLNIAMGNKIAKKQDSTFNKLKFGVTAGTDQFEQGMINLFKPLSDDTYIPSSPTQVASGIVREGLKDSGFKIYGTSIGQGAYDLITTTSNMLPSIGASYLSNAIVPGSGAIVGASLMGGSAAGNSYQEKLNAGWDKKQAFTYATVVGASEAGLQYALGGIGSLGGKITGKSAQAIARGIDKAALRFAVNYGMNVASEGLEEALQEVLNPFFENLALGYQKNDLSDVEWEQVAYSGVLGALSAGFLEGGSTAINVFGENANANKMGKYLKQNDFTSKVLEIASSSPKGSEAYELYTTYKNKGVNAENISELQLGRLFVNAESDVKNILSKKKIDSSEETSARATLDELISMRPESSMSIGDKFKDTKTGRTFTVVGRNNETTVVEIETPKGTKSQAFADSRIGSLIASGQIEKIDSGQSETVTAEDTSVVEDTTAETTQTENPNINVGDVYENSFTGVTYTVLGRNGESVKILTKDKQGNTKVETPSNAQFDTLLSKDHVTKVQGENNAITNVFNTLSGEKLSSKTIDKITSTPELKEAFEQITGLKLVGTKAEQRATVRNWHNDAKNVSVLNEYASADEVTPSAEEGATDGKIQSVVDAMNDTLREGALDEIYESMPEGYEKSLDVYAEVLIPFYEQQGTIGHIAEYFTDGGKKVVDAIEGSSAKSNPRNETVVETTTNTENALQNQSKSATIKEKNTNTVSDADKSHTVAYTNDNEKIDMKFKVVSVDDLVASNEIDGRINPNYPQELQPRDRRRAASQNQIRQIANDLNPERLAESTNVSEGAPIVGPDNVVESGNGRTLAIKLAYQLGSAEEYRNFIINNANVYGIDVSNLPEKPVLVRERLTEVDRVEFTRKANESSISSLSATEQARVDAENLTQDVLNLLVANDDGEINTPDNRNFISAVIDKVFNNEDLNNVVGAEGKLSQRGKERIQNAIFYKAYGDASLSARLSESLDNDMKNATKVLLNIAPKVVYIKNGIASGNTYDFDFSGDIASAVRLFEMCRNENLTIKDYAMQMSFIEKESQLVMRMAYIFETKNRGAKQATDFYNLLLDTVDELGDPNQLSLGITEVFETKEEIFNAANKRYNEGVEPKNTITIPESLSGPDSESRRDDDRRGRNEVVGDNTSRSETSGNPVGVQQDNGPGEETRVTADDEQLRPKKESVAGKSEVKEENSNEERRNDLLPNNSRRGDDGDTGKQTRQIQSFERKNQGKNAIERRKFGRELIKRGQVEKVNDGTHEYTLVKPEAYNEDMKSMVAEAKKNGRELSFFIGTATVTKENGDTFEADGIRFGGTNRIAVQYDGHKTPQKLAKHETIHSKWLTPKVQKIAKKILASLDEADRQKIAEQNRYEYYKEIFEEEIANGEVDVVWEEFVCDVMSGMNDYTINYIDDVNTFWYGNEEAEGYDPASYATSTDAGGNKYSFSSLGFAFFGDENITSEEFEKMVSDGSYKKKKGYRDYVKKCVDIYKQSRGTKKMLPGSEVKKIERQIEGIMKVAIAAKKAGYDIYDDGNARSVKDSKNRLLFSSLEPNSDYVTSSDIATICDKRTNFSEIYDDIVSLEEERGVPANKRFFKNVDNYFILHKIMADKGLTIPCEECYVESMRKNLGSMAQAFIDLVKESDENNKSNEQLYHQKGKDKGKLKTNNAIRRTTVRELLAENEIISADDLTVEMLTTAKGLAKLRLQAPLVYEQFNAFYGQAKPKLTREATPFRPGELIALLTKNDGTIDTALVKEIVATGGFRLQSYSDFQIKNFVDVLQTIFEAGMLGLNGHAYTKVPTFLEATDGTNLKRNISIFMYEDGGNWVLDKKNSFPMELEDIYALVASDESGNTGIIAVSQNADMSAWIMANDNVGYGIPFHKSGLKMEVVRGRIVKTADGREIQGYANEIDHTKQQSEVYKKTVSAKEKANTKVKKSINIYQFWDFKNKDNLSQKKLIEKNVKRYIDECEKRNYRPKFRAYVMNNGKLLNKILEYSKELGTVPQNATVEDISFKHGEYTIPYGYYKFIGDFGMFKPDGTASSIETLSLENYDFDKAVDFFKYSSKLRQNELLQQLENGEVREQYRKMLKNGELSIEQLDDIIKQKRSEVVEDVVGNRYSVAEEESDTTKLSEGSEINESANSSGVEERGTYQNNDSIWQRSDDSEEIYKSMGNGKILLRGSQEKGNRLIDWGRRFGDLDVFEPSEKERAYGILRKISQLNIASRDSDGRKLSKEQKEFFKDTVAKNSKGELFTLYHATDDEFEVFSFGDFAFHIGTLNQALNVDNEAKKYIKEVYVNITNPIYIPEDTMRWYGLVIANKVLSQKIISTEEYDAISKLDGFLGYDYNSEANIALRTLLQSKGYDGIVYNNGVEGDALSFMAFDSNQIKYTSNRTPTKSPDNRYSIAEESYAPTFYSKMSKVIDEMKQDKIAAKDVIRYLTDTKRGVKAEEIKWSGIEEFLEGRKSVTKAELQEFVANNQLEIEEVTLDNNEISYTEEQTAQIEEYEKERNEIFEELKSEWKKAIGTEFPMQNFGIGLEFSVTNLLSETNRLIKESNSDNEYKSAKEQLWSIFAEEDFGYDYEQEAFRDAVRTPREFMESFELTDEQKAIFERFIKAKENFKKAEGIPLETQRHLKDIAARSDEISRKISRMFSEHYKENKKYMTKWSEYSLDGGENYREIIFKIPDSIYSNNAMKAHWDGSVATGEGVLAHARIQDFDIYGKKMLFIEEIQSDWHNEGHQKGYIGKNDADILAKRKELESYIKSRLGQENSAEEIAKLQEARREYIRLGKNMNNADAVPDAPFRDNYHEYVLKRLIRMAAEEGYDSIGWTTADIQSKRWSDEYAEGYRIEYDQEIPKFLNKYGKKWGAKVGKTEIRTETDDWYEADGTEVWSMPITESMKNSVLYEGQTRYSLATDGIPDINDLWDFAIKEYGTIKKGETPARDVEVPKKINEKDVVSLGARTMMEAGITPDDAVSEFEKAILDGTMTHEVITNKKAGAWAKQQIERLGFEEALNRWSVLSDSGKVGKKELALGMELYNQCITNKDVHNAMKVAAELVAEATNAGQTLQAVRMLKRMTPDGQLYYIEKSVQKMNEEFKDKLGKRFKDIELDESLIKEFLTETDAEKRDEVYDKICQHIADQMPSTFKDKWNAWRYLAMLGNPRTHIRNLVGNAIFVPSIRLKNYIGAIIEKTSKVDVAERTKSLHKSKEAVEFAKQDITDKDVMRELKGINSKYATTDDIESKRTIFDKWWQRWAEKLRNKNFEWLEKEDGWFLKLHYVDALSRLITARKIDVNSITPQMLEQLRAYAIKEAQVATYRDANALADGLNAIQRKLERSDKKIVRASSVLIEGVMPFKKTPMNIAKQGIYYSPVGILKGIYTATTKLKKGDTTVTDVIDDLSKGLSGTMVMMLGFFLASLGLLVGDDDKTNKEKEFDKMTGEQSYALKIGDFSYTIDWAAPSNLALFVGSKLYDLTKDEFSFADVTSALSTVTEPLLELSVFSGVSGVIESAQYSDSNPVIAITSDMITSYLMQALPTIGGQVSRIVDDSKREYYYVDKTSDVPKGLQRLIGQASSKIPFASYLFETAIDEWGREETYGNIVERAFENTISPGYYAAENYTSVDRKLRQLYEKTGDSAVLPVIQQKYYTEDYVKYDMSADEYTKVKKLRGKKSFELVRELLSSSDYMAMDDKEKVKAIKKCYTEAGDYAKEQMIEKVKRK